MASNDITGDLEALLQGLGNRQSTNVVTASTSVVTQLPPPYASQEEINDGSATGSASISKVQLVAGANLIELPAPAFGAKAKAYLVQPSGGNGTVTWSVPSGALHWAGAAAPTLTASANAVDSVEFECMDGVNWYGIATLHYA